MTTTYELYTNENGTPKAVEGKAPAIIERVEALETDVTGLDTALEGKAPMSHTHTSADVTDLNVTISNALKPYATTNTVNTELAKKANESHTHAVSDVDGLQVALDGKLDATAKAESAKVADSANSVSWDNVTGKPSISSSPEAYITETWHSGESWYRKWSDGFIEQGGILKGRSGTVSFHKGFSNTNYTFLHTPNLSNTSGQWFAWEVSSKTTASIKISMVGGANTAPSSMCWVAYGY